MRIWMSGGGVDGVVVFGLYCDVVIVCEGVNEW